MSSPIEIKCNTETDSDVMWRTKEHQTAGSLQFRPHYRENPTSGSCEIVPSLPDLVSSISLSSSSGSLHSRDHKCTTDGASVRLSKPQSLGVSLARRSFSPSALASRVTSAFWRRVCFCMFPPLIGLNDFSARIKTQRSRLLPPKLVTRERIFKTGLELEACPPEML